MDHRRFDAATAALSRRGVLACFAALLALPGRAEANQRTRRRRRQQQRAGKGDRRARRRRVRQRRRLDRATVRSCRRTTPVGGSCSAAMLRCCDAWKHDRPNQRYCDCLALTGCSWCGGLDDRPS